MTDVESGEKPGPAVDEKPRAGANAPLQPWEGRPQPAEAIAILESRALADQEWHARMEAAGMPVAVSAKREAYVMRWLAQWFLARQIEQQKKDQWRR